MHSNNNTGFQTFFFQLQEKKLVAEIKRTAKTGNEVSTLILYSVSAPYFFYLDHRVWFSFASAGSNKNSSPSVDQVKAADF